MSGIHNPLNPTEILANLATLQADVTDILAVTNALPTLTTNLGATTTTVIDTEYNLYINNAPLGVYKPILLKVWLLGHQATETVIFRTFYRLADGGVWVEEDTVTLVGLSDEGFINIDLNPTRWGVQTTIERTAGTAREYPWEVFYEI